MIEGHGDDSYKYSRPITANFSSNVYGHPDLSGLLEHLAHCVRADGGRKSLVSSYPEPEPYTLEAELARLMRLEPASVCVTNGATEAIYLIAQTFGGTRTAILQPTFSEYADACVMHGHRVSSLYSLPSEREHFLLPKDIRMLWLCNPNNPTGSVTDKGWLETLIECNPQVCFVIDQSYEHFTRRLLFSAAEAARYPNVLLLHSLTKHYAIPGLRLGFITGNEGLLARIRTHRMPWSVNAFAIEAGLYLASKGMPNPVCLDECLKETARLRERLEQLGALEVWDSDTHFMLVRLRFGKASALKEYLAEKHGILIRDASNFEGLDERFFRIATQTPEENNRLVEAIAEWLQE